MFDALSFFFSFLQSVHRSYFSRTKIFKFWGLRFGTPILRAFDTWLRPGIGRIPPRTNCNTIYLVRGGNGAANTRRPNRCRIQGERVGPLEIVNPALLRIYNFYPGGVGSSCISFVLHLCSTNEKLVVWGLVVWISGIALWKGLGWSIHFQGDICVLFFFKEV